MDIKLEPSAIWSEYTHLQEYLTRNNVYETVKINENFYDGKQWEGVKAENMPKPVFNFMKRTGKYMIATLASNDISVSITPFSENPDDIKKFKPISDEVKKVIERAKLKEASRVIIRNGFVDGSGFMMQSFDADYETGQPLKGCIENTIINNTNVYFGNPHSSNIQKQPYIIISLKQDINQVKDEARENGVPEELIDQIKPDTNSNEMREHSDNLVTVLIKYYRKNQVIKNTVIDEEGNVIETEEKTNVKEVHFIKTTSSITLIPETSLGYSRYPISCFGWDPVSDSYLYTSPMTEAIPNQIFVNKCFAIAQMYGLQSAFPKIVYDKNKVNITNFLNKQTPNAVSGIDMMGKFLDFIKVPDFSNNILTLIDTTIHQMKECIGVNDATLGNVKPDNTSAIIALQEASNVPLELQRQQFYCFWEDTVRNIIDIMANNYGERDVIVDVE